MTYYQTVLLNTAGSWAKSATIPIVPLSKPISSLVAHLTSPCTVNKIFISKCKRPSHNNDFISSKLFYKLLYDCTVFFSCVQTMELSGHKVSQFIVHLNAFCMQIASVSLQLFVCLFVQCLSKKHIPGQWT